MAKEQHSIKLHGHKLDGIMASSHTADQVRSFKSFDKKFIIKANKDKSVTLYTAKGCYKLIKHSSANRYQGTCGDIKVHFCPAKITGKLIYWA